MNARRNAAALALTLGALLGCSKQEPPPLPRAATLYRPEAWFALGGDWAARQAEIQNASQERGAKLISSTDDLRDFAVQADIDIAEPYGEAGLMIRSSGEQEGVDAYHGYFAGINRVDSSYVLGRADFGWHPLIHRSLPAHADLQAPVQIRLVAAGCRFAVAITLADGETAGSTADDPDCIRQGRFGLRSSSTSATWKNLKLTAASEADIAAIGRQNAAGADLPLAEPFDAPELDRYASSFLEEAKLHQLAPGVQPIVNFLMSPGSHPHTTIQGSIISTPPLTAIQDDSGALILPDLDPKTPIRMGDVVEAEGTVVSDRFRSRMEDAKLRVLWSDTEIPPLDVTAAQLTVGTYRGRSIQVEGILRSATFRPDGYDLVLDEGGQSFRAVGAKNFEIHPERLQIGSRLRLKGMATSLPQFTDGLYPFVIITNRVDTLSAPPWWSPRHIVLLAAAGLCCFLSMQFFLHRLQRWHMRSVLKEREQLAFEMHDTLAQSFTGIAYQLQAASAERRGEQMMQAHIRSALQMVSISHREASRTIAALRPQYRDASGILSALRESAERLSDGGALAIETVLEGKLVELPLEVTDIFFRIGQEAIANAIQHSACTALTIGLKLSRREAELTVRDNGHGFLEDAAHRGLGIDSMRKRAARINARFELASAPGGGTSITLRASLPFARGWRYRLRAKLGGATRGDTHG